MEEFLGVLQKFCNVPEVQKEVLHVYDVAFVGYGRWGGGGSSVISRLETEENRGISCPAMGDVVGWICWGGCH